MFIKFVGTVEETEKAVKSLDKILRHFFNVYGVKRLNSFFNQFGFRLHEIKIAMSGFMYDFIRECFLHELIKFSGKEIIIASETIEGNEKSIVIVFAEQARKQEKRA